MKNFKNKEKILYDTISEKKQKKDDKWIDKSILFYNDNLYNNKIIQTKLNREDSDDNKSIDKKKIK